MQRGTRVGSDSCGPAARKGARPSSTGMSGSAPAGGGGRAIRPRSASEKNPEPTTRAKAAGISKPARRAAKPFTNTPDPTPVTLKRLPTVLQQKKMQRVSIPEFSSTNQDEQHCDGEDAEIARDDASDAATVNWILSGDYRLVTAVRVRPMLPSEKKKGYRRIVEMAPPDDGGWTRIVNPVALTTPLSPLPDKNGDSPAAPVLPNTNKQFTHEFAFDHSFWSYDHAPARQVATQSVVYESLGGLAIETILQGFNCSILAYGQSGTGKTFTMMGSSTTAKIGTSTSGSSTRVTSRTVSRSTGNGSTTSGNTVASRRGLIPRICRGLFDRLEELQQDFGDKSSVHVSYVEIYNERVFDLLPALANSKKSLEPLKVREHPEEGTYVENARQVRTTTFEAIQTLLEDGNRQRSVATTTLNSRSSRSHTILMLTLAHQTPPPLSAGKEGHSAIVRKSKLYLVDLAGSERSDTTEANSSWQRESNIINKSLTTLADVISALTKQRATGISNNINASGSAPFVPYRNSVLTRLLKESLGGDATTVLLATISPCCAHFEDSLSTLKFIGRAKSALSVPKLSSSPTSTLLSSGSTAMEKTTGLDLVHELQKEIVELKDKLNAPPPANDTCRPSFTLAWESPSPDSIMCRCKKSSPDSQPLAQKPVDSSAAGPSQLRDELDPLEAAMQWAMQSEASPLSPKPEIQSSCEDATKICNTECSLEQELTSLQLLLSRKESADTVASPRRLEVTRDLVPRVRALGNIVAIYRRFAQLRTFRAFLMWRITSKPTVRIQDTSVQTETSSPNNITKLQEARQVETLCCSIVSDFIFSTSDNEVTSTHGPSSFEVSDIEQQEMDSNTLSIIIDEYDQLSPLEGGSPPEEDNTSAPSSKDMPSDRQQCILAKLASCLDSIDLARKALGPTLRRIRDIATRIGSPTIAFQIATEEERSSVGIEQSLLVHIDKILFSVSQYIDTMQNGLAQRTYATVTHGVAATAVFDLMEALIGAFCMHMMGRVNDQLANGSSGCSIGRLELESQLQTFREQLLQLVQLANVIMARGELHPRDHDVVLLVVIELTALCERVKCVWQAIEQRKRHQLVNRRLSSASAEALDCLNAKLRNAESKAKAYGESLDSKVLEMARAEEELAGAMEILNRMEEDHANHIATLEIQLAEAESRVTEFEQNSLTAAITGKTQSIRIEELELQLDEVNKNLQTLKDGQDGVLTGDETSPITLRCGNLMVRLEEELTSALSRMNAMEVPNVPLDPVAAACLDPETSEYALSDDIFNVHRELEADVGELSDGQYATGERFSIQTREIESEQNNDHEDVGDIKAAMERDLMAASAHEHELETQLSDAMSQVCHLQTQHDALTRSVQSLNNELSEALERIAFLEDEKLQLDHRGVDANAGVSGDEDKVEANHRLIFTMEDESIQVEHNLGLSRDEEELTCNEELTKYESDMQRHSSTIDLQLLYEESQQAPVFERADGTRVEDTGKSERNDRSTHEQVLCLERDDLKAVRRDLREARASLISSTIKLGASRSMCRSLEQLCQQETARNSELEDQCAEYQNKLTTTLSVQTKCEQWKCAWADAIVQCGSLKAALSSAHTRNEDLEKLMLHESSIARQFAGKLESLALELLECEQTKAAVINKFDILGKEMVQYRCQSDEMRTKIDELEALDRQREVEYMELQLLHNLSDQEKRRLQGSYEQSEILIESIEKELKLSQELLSTREIELDTIRSAKAELDEKMATLLCSAKRKDDEWRQKESTLLDELNQTKQLLEDAKNTSLESSHYLKIEQARVLELLKQVNNYQENEKELLEISATLKLTNEELQTSISAKQENLQCKIAELQILAAEHELLMQQLAMSVADRESWSNLAEAYKSKCLNQEEECDKLRLSVSTLHPEVLRLRDVAAASVTRATSQDYEIARLRSDLHEDTETKKRLEDARSKLEGKLHHQILLNQSVKAEIREKLLQLEHLETANTDLKCQMESILAEMKTLMKHTNIYGERALEAKQKLAIVEGSLQHELEHSKELMTQLEISRSDLAGRDTSLQVMAERIAHLNKTMAFQRSSHDELIGKCASLAHQNKLLRSQIGEERENSLMAFAELESFRSYVVAHPDMFNRMRSALLLNQTVGGYSDGPPEESKRVIMRHLSSLDEWFERTIVGGLPDESPASSTTSLNASLGPSAVAIDFSDLDELLEMKSSSVSASGDLDTITNELLQLCVVPVTSKQSRTDTIDAILMPVGSQYDVEERSSDSSTTEWDDCGADPQVIERVTVIADLDDNNASDRGIPDDFSSKTMKSEPEVSGSEIEIAQLKSTIWRLKEVLDVKDDMLSFLDGKLSYYEKMVGKHPFQQSLLDSKRNQTPRTAAYPRRR